MKSILQLLEVFSDTFLGRKQRDVMHFSVATASDSDRNIGIARDTISPKGIEMICRFEGLQLSAYDDGVGVWSIGFGTIVYPSGTRVRKGDICTLEQAKFYMSHDLKKFEHAVDLAVKVSIDQRGGSGNLNNTYK